MIATCVFCRNFHLRNFDGHDQRTVRLDIVVMDIILNGHNHMGPIIETGLFKVKLH